MAAALARQMLPASLQVGSAGVRKGELDPFAVAAMAEAGIDIADHGSDRHRRQPRATPRRLSCGTRSAHGAHSHALRRPAKWKRMRLRPRCAEIGASGLEL
jgi:hypothetical protein